MRHIVKAVLTATAALAATVAVAFGPVNSKVDIEKKTEDGKLALAFKVVPNDGLVINLEGPWKLEITNPGGLAFAKTTWNKPEMDEKLTGFVVKTDAAPAQPGGTLEYALTAFVCTANKTSCYRDVLKGSYAWTK